MRPAFLPPNSGGRKHRLLTMIPKDQASVFGWAVDGDPFCLRLRSLGLRQNDFKNAVLERGLDLVFINVRADRNLPFEAAVETFLNWRSLSSVSDFISPRIIKLPSFKRTSTSFSSMPGISAETVICFSVSATSSLGQARFTNSVRCPASEVEAKPRKASSRRRFISRCNVKNGLDLSSRKNSRGDPDSGSKE